MTALDLPGDRDGSRRSPTSAFTKWEIVPAALIVAGSLGWALPAVLHGSPLDLGLAYKGGEEAWASGRPERLGRWMSTSFLAMVMAVVSRLVPLSVAKPLITTLNVGLAALTLAGVWHALRGKVTRAWWWITLAVATCYAPLLSSVFMKQINVPALALALAGFALIRGGRAAVGSALVALSVSVKPVVILLPVALLARRDTRRSGLYCILWGLVFLATAQIFLAIRAGDVEVLSPITALSSFATRSAPWVCHPENFSPQGLLCRLMDEEGRTVQRLFGSLAAFLMTALANDAIKDRPGCSWEVFGFVCLLSPMVGPIAWSHYQLFLAPRRADVGGLAVRAVCPSHDGPGMAHGARRQRLRRRLPTGRTERHGPLVCRRRGKARTAPAPRTGNKKSYRSPAGGRAG